jgi:aminoglycoside 6'-N-acetyltransferase I
MPLTIRAVRPEDALTWERLRFALWPGEDETHGEVTSAYFTGTRDDPAHVLLAEGPDGTLAGFAELSIRTDVEGLVGERTGYVEGLYVLPQSRFQGVAGQLLCASREWSRLQRCTRFASDREDRVIIDHTFTPAAQSHPQPRSHHCEGA